MFIPTSSSTQVGSCNAICRLSPFAKQTVFDLLNATYTKAENIASVVHLSRLNHHFEKRCHTYLDSAALYEKFDFLTFLRMSMIFL